VPPYIEKKTLREHRTKIIRKRKRKCSVSGSGAAVATSYGELKIVKSTAIKMSLKLPAERRQR